MTNKIAIALGFMALLSASSPGVAHAGRWTGVGNRFRQVPSAAKNLITKHPRLAVGAGVATVLLLTLPENWSHVVHAAAGAHDSVYTFLQKAQSLGNETVLHEIAEKTQDLVAQIKAQTP